MAGDEAPGGRRRPVYERMQARDSGFLVFERPDLPMTVGGLLFFEAAPLRGPDGFLDRELMLRYVQAQLHRVPRYLQRVASVPFFRSRVWTDDVEFDVRRHVGFTSCPAPGGDTEVQQVIGELLSQPLDRSKPLWEAWFVEGVAGERIAVLVKAHHALGDGRATVELMRRILQPAPRTEAPPARTHTPLPLPKTSVLLRDEATRWLRAPVGLAGSVRRLVTSGETARAAALKLRGVAATLRLTARLTSKTPLNRRVGGQRRIAWTAMDDERLRPIRAQSGASLHEVALAILAGALRRVFLERGEPLPRLRAMAPTSGLTKAELGLLGNRVYAPLVDLPLDLADPRERLRRVRQTRAQLERNAQGVAWDVMMEAADWLGARSQAFSMWFATRMRAYNIVLTLVPGPRFPVYLLGARLHAIYPVLPLLDRQTITVGVLAYEDRLHWGIVSAPEYAEAFSELAPLLQESLAELERAYAESEPQPLAQVHAK